jgi:hypothetical protein
MGVSKTSPNAAFSAVVWALFSLQAFDRKRKRPTKLVADESHLSTKKAIETLKFLAVAGIVGTTQTIRRAVWVVRKVTGMPSTRFKKAQFLNDASMIQRLAQSDVKARTLLGRTNLKGLDVNRNKVERSFFNAIVRALTAAGHKGLPMYDIASGSYHWWLRITSRTAASKAIQRLTGQTTLEV